jgi:type I restriction enzyme, S subunit
MSSKWPIVKLGCVLSQYAEYIDTPEPREYPKLSVKLYGRGVVLDTPANGATLKMMRHQLAKSGQVILSEIWGKKGAIGFVPDEGEGALCTSHFFLFDINDKKLDRQWLQAIFDANYLEQQLDAQAKGTTGYAAVRPKTLLACEIPLPPLPEQRRIVMRIEELGTKINEARGLRRRATEAAEALVSARISRLFEHDTCWTRVENAVSKCKGAVRSGPFGSQLHHEEFTESGVVAIGTRDVQTNRLEFKSGWFVSTDKFAQLQRYRVLPRDLLCTIVGASIGRFCVVPSDIPLAFTTKHVQALTLDFEKADPHFVSLMLNFHRRSRDSLFSRVEGSAQPSLNATKVLATALPLPSLSEQRRVVAYFNELQQKVVTLQALQTKIAEELDALLPSILDKAFAGVL